MFIHAVLLVTALLFGCSRPQAVEPPNEVTLYTSADADVVTPIVDAFEKDTGIKVRWIGDTEATKTTGLVQRLKSEKDAPRADVWWSSEPFGTIKLARAGMLAPYTSDAAEKSIDSGWPKALRSKDRLWYGFAQRSRVIVYKTDKVKAGDAPRTLADLADAKYKNRVGMARPGFGTTTGHMGAIALIHSPKGLRDWLTMMHANGVRLYNGNSAVVRAVATGEIFVGLTDTDDVWAGQKEAWPVALVYERNDLAANPSASFKPPPDSLKVGCGPLVLPNTVALIKGAPHENNATKLIDFLLSEKVERMLASSDSHNLAVHPKVASDPAFSKYAIKDPMNVNLEQVADQIEEAMKACDEIMK